LLSCPITADSVRAIGDLPCLEELDLRCAAVDDSSLQWLSRLSLLRKLQLTGTRVTDKGLPFLTDSVRLDELCVCATPVTADGIEFIRRALPHTRIDASARQTRGWKDEQPSVGPRTERKSE
jgi:hypothetical protein